MTAIPELVDILEIEGSVITTDAIGATKNIMNAVHNNKGDFVPEKIDFAHLLW